MKRTVLRKSAATIAVQGTAPLSARSAWRKAAAFLIAVLPALIAARRLSASAAPPQP